MALRNCESSTSVKTSERMRTSSLYEETDASSESRTTYEKLKSKRLSCNDPQSSSSSYLKSGNYTTLGSMNSLCSSHYDSDILTHTISGESFAGDLSQTIPESEEHSVTEPSHPTVNNTFDARYATPKPGETLISFLSSGDLYNNYESLERENAHFYISEALMAAFEQMRFDADCRAAGLLPPLAARDVATTSADSTTDFSVYESPQSSSHTESSGAESDLFKTSARVLPRNNGSSRVRRRIMKRSTPRYGHRDDATDATTATEDDAHFRKASSSTGDSSQSNDVTDFGRCVKDEDDGRSVLIEKLSTTSSNQIEDYFDDRIQDSGETSSTNTVRIEGCATQELEGTPPNMPHQRSAEGIGLSMLQSMPAQNRLPAASELQWLVSETDAPQELLPMPPALPRVLLRGTQDWAPPREQLILSLPEELTRTQRMAVQAWRCAGCGTRVNRSLSRYYRLCHYFSRYFCCTCHMNATAAIPARLLHLWDARPRPVSCVAARLLARLRPLPLLYPAHTRPALYRRHTPLQQFCLYRLQLYRALPYWSTCARAGKDKEAAGQFPDHWSEGADACSLEELLELTHALTRVRAVVDACVSHVAACQLCQARGHVCSVCRSGRAVFPFELAAVRVCVACGACSHRACVAEKCGLCVARGKRA